MQLEHAPPPAPQSAAVAPPAQSPVPPSSQQPPLHANEALPVKQMELQTCGVAEVLHALFAGQSPGSAHPHDPSAWQT